MLTLSFTVALVYIIVLVSPGPDFFFVSQTAISRSCEEVMMDVLGITRGVVVQAGMALLSLHLIVEKVAQLHTIIMVGGGLYLYQMGCQMLCGAFKKQDVVAPTPQVELAQSGRSFLKGLLTSLANSKAITYFGSIFLLFVGGNMRTGAHQGIFALVIVETLAWFTVVASLFTLPKIRRGYQRLAKWIDGFADTLFAGFGIHLIISR